MNKRLEVLEKMVKQSSDPFARYALAMEYMKVERGDDALATFEALRGAHPDYLPMYLMAGQLLIQRQQGAQARDWLNAGIALAGRIGDMKALSELESALSTVID